MTDLGIPTVAELKAQANASRDRPSQWETAFHEAGHVVVEVALSGSFPDSVHLSDEPGTDHAGRTTTRSFMDAYAVVDTGGDERIAGVLAQRRTVCAAVVLAGQLAKDIALDHRLDISDLTMGIIEDDCDGAPESAGDDATLVRRLVAVADLDGGAAEVFVEEAAELAVETLHERWADVRSVASALVERRKLDREDLWDLLEPEQGEQS